MNQPERPDYPTRWVCFRLGHLGDVALTTGVLAWLGENRGWSFDCITGASWAGLYDNNPYVGRVIVLDKGMTTAQLARYYREIADDHHGWGLLDLHGNLRSRLLAAIWQGPVARYRKLSLERRLFLLAGKRLKGDVLRSLNVPQRYALSVASSPPARSAVRPRIYIDDAERNEAVAVLHRLGPAGVAGRGEGKGPIALHPYSTHPLKAWPESRFRQLAASLDELGVPWICVGQGKPLFPERREDLTNATSLRQLAALLEQCRVLVTGDSGPMHLATGVGTPVLALFGPTTEEWGFFPSGPSDAVLQLPLACRPCSLHGKKPCPRGQACLEAIGPEQVLSALSAADFLAGPGSL